MSVFANGKEQPPCSTKRGAHLEFLRGGRGDLGEDCPQALKIVPFFLIFVPQFMPLNFVPITIDCLFKPKFVPHRATIRAIFTDFYVVFLAKSEQFGSSGRLSDFHLRIRSPKRSFIKPISAKIRVFLLQKAPKIQIMQKTGVNVWLFSCFLPSISVKKW